MTGGERSDEALLRAHVDGDSAAFAELVGRHQDRLWAVAIRTIGDREDAADALQDALLSAHRSAGRFRGDSAVTTWLHRIVVNACLDRIRRRQAHRTVPLLDGTTRSGEAGDRQVGAEPAAPAPDHDTALVVRQALGQLAPEQRVALVLVDVQGYSVAEAATLMGVAEGTIKSRCARGRARLAVLLGYLRPGGARTGRESAAGEPAEPGSPGAARNDPGSAVGAADTESPTSSEPAAQVGNPLPAGSVPSKGSSAEPEEHGAAWTPSGTQREERT